MMRNEQELRGTAHHEAGHAHWRETQAIAARR